MVKYITPADVGVSDNRQDHINRGSAEPGTDYMTTYGTDLRMGGDGYVSYIEYGNGNPGGRRLQITVGDETLDYIHLSRVMASVGDRVSAGQTGLCLSGASGFGRDWYYGSHVHVTRRKRGASYRDTLDFESVAGSPASAAPAVNNPNPSEEYPEMFYAVVKGAWYLVGATPGAGKPFTAVILGANAVGGQAVPVVQFEWQNSIDRLKAVTHGIY